MKWFLISPLTKRVEKTMGEYQSFKKKKNSLSTYCLKTYPKTHYEDHVVLASIKHAVLQIAMMQWCNFLFPLSKQRFDLVPRQTF